MTLLQEIVGETGLAVLPVTRDRDLAEKVFTRIIDLEDACGVAS